MLCALPPGSAAVVLGQHPGWAAWQVRSAIVNTADESVLRTSNGTCCETAVFNVGSGTKTSILDLIGALEAAVGHDLKVLKEPARAGDIRRSRADTANTRKALGWEATTPLREGLRRILETGP